MNFGFILLFFSVIFSYKIKYKVKNGESLYTISKKFRVSINDLKKWNNLKSDLIHPGKTLVIIKPDRFKKIKYKVKKNDTLLKIAKKFNVSVKDLKKWNKIKNNIIVAGKELVIYKKLKPVNKAVKKKQQKAKVKVLNYASKSGRAGRKSGKHKIPKLIFTYYKVKKGDSLWKIARKYKIRVKDIRRYNSKKKLKLLLPGEKIKIPVKNPAYIYVVRPYLKDFVRLEKSDLYKIKNYNNVWGQKYAIDLLKKCIEKIPEKFPNSAKIVIGDISKKYGGYFPPHLSHRTGRDVDIGYFLKNNEQLNYFKTISPSQLDVEKTWFLIEQCLKTGMVEFIFIDWNLQKPLYEYAKKLGFPKSELDYLFQYPAKKTVKKGIIRHFRGHKHHLHIRFKCPKNNKNCR